MKGYTECKSHLTSQCLLRVVLVWGEGGGGEVCRRVSVNEVVNSDQPSGVRENIVS